MRAVLLLGHKSPYGLAHLEPVLDLFDVAAVVVASERRWAQFRRSLSGQPLARRPKVRDAINLGRGALRRWVRNRSLRSACAGKGVPLIEVFDVNAPSFIKTIASLRPVVLLGAAYPQIFGSDLLAVPARGAINFHPSLLPEFRGAHPHFWAIAQGEQYGGITAHYMTERIDEGDIAVQIRFPIDHYRYGDLYAKLKQETPNVVKALCEYLDDPNSRPVPQDANAASYYRNDRAIHRRIFWNVASCLEIVNLVRAERAYFFVGSDQVTVLEAAAVHGNRNMTNNVAVAPGTVVDISEHGVIVATRSVGDYISIRSVRMGRRRLDHGRWAAAHKLAVGRIFD